MKRTTNVLMLVSVFKKDSRLSEEFLSVNEFVGTIMGRYDPEKRKWKNV